MDKHNKNSHAPNSLTPESRVFPFSLSSSSSSTNYLTETLYYPQNRLLMPYRSDCMAKMKNEYHLIHNIEQSISELLSAHDYPCIAAKRSFEKDDYLVGLYQDFGTGQSSSQLGRDLLIFLQEQ